MNSYIEAGENFMHLIQNAFDLLCKEANLINGSEETQNLTKHFQKIISDNESILNDLKSQREEMIENEIKLQCDKEQLELELETVEEQLKIHVRHSGTDQNMLLKLMTEVEDLREENYDLSERLSQEIQNNQRRLNLLNNNKNNLNKKDIKHFMQTIEKYHCKLLSLEAVIEQLRRNGIQIPLFPTIQRQHKSVQCQQPSIDTSAKKNNVSVKSDEYNIDETKQTNETKDQQKINELLKEIKYLRSQNDVQSDKFRDINDMAQQLKKQLLHQQNKYKKLKNKNFNLKSQISEQQQFIDTSGRERVLKLVMLIAFVVGITYRKSKPMITKKYFDL